MRRRGFCQILLELNKFFFMKYRKNSGCTAIFTATNEQYEYEFGNLAHGLISIIGNLGILIS